MSKDTDKVVSYVQSLDSLDGEVVLLHSIYESTVEAVRVLVPWLIEKGYQLVTVSELMAYYYGELLEPGEFFGYTYFTTHGRTDTPAVLPDGSAGGNGTKDEAADSVPSDETVQPPAGEAQPGKPDGGTDPADPGSTEVPGDTIVLDGSGGEETVRPEKPSVPAAPSGEENPQETPAPEGGAAAGEGSSGSGGTDLPSSL